MANLFPASAPTASDFHVGAFDITDFKAILSPDSSTVTFKLQLRDLSPTFGSPLGAQLVDVYGCTRRLRSKEW